ncbi:MAG: class I tRNA ligase family protein, partial [Patescibacteria group bacterium]
FGATYMVLAPEHELIENLKLKIENWDEVLRYIVISKKKTEIERTTEGREKTGIELRGIKAINPANGEEVPIFIADYVLAHYGTGAIMAVPAHDERDFAFAEKFDLPKPHVIEPYFVTGAGKDGVRDDKKTVERDAITAIVKHWAEDKYLVLKWKNVNWHTFITGGVEKGQTPEGAARAEILEETGYSDIKTASELPRFHARFFHVPKDENRFAHFRTFYFELESGAQAVVSDDERARHDYLWLAPNELVRVITPEGHHYVWNEFKNGASAYAGIGILTNSGRFDGMESEAAKKAITEFVGGEMKTTYKLRDWVFSRQRYWGEPIPVVHCEKCGYVPVKEEDLPVLLPEVKTYTPTKTGESPLAKIDSWVNVRCPKCGGGAKRETDTMPNWAGSSWYFLRYIDPRNETTLADRKKLDNFMPVDWYNGGMEHTTLHLLYSRFWHKFLFDIGVVPASEPYAKRTSHGMILAEGGEKMSKSKGNVVNPDSIVENFGADTLRLYEMFMGPFDQSVAWSAESIIGPRRFLERVWKLKDNLQLTTDNSQHYKKIETQLHRKIKKVGEDVELMHFNTAVSEMMILANEMDKLEKVPQDYFEVFLKLLSPFAPHITEEIWNLLGHKKSIHQEPWPKYDESKLESATINLAVQVNGKVRAVIEVPAAIGEEEAKNLATKDEKIKTWIGNKEIKRIIYIKGKLISIVLAS